MKKTLILLTLIFVPFVAQAKCSNATLKLAQDLAATGERAIREGVASRVSMFPLFNGLVEAEFCAESVTQAVYCQKKKALVEEYTTAARERVRQGAASTKELSDVLQLTIAYEKVCN